MNDFIRALYFDGYSVNYISKLYDISNRYVYKIIRMEVKD